MKSEDILLSILTPSIPSRAEMLSELTLKLRDQIGELPAEHRTLVDQKVMRIGEKRDALLRMARGKFVTQLDDDDLPAPNYISELIAAIQAHPNVDCIVFSQHAIIDGKKMTVRFGLEYENEQAQIAYDGQFYDIVRKPFPCCAWRRELAQKYHFPPENYGEDWEWVKQLLTEAKTQHRINKVLHSYRFSSTTSEAKDDRKVSRV